jgi:hypothetical protein
VSGLVPHAAAWLAAIGLHAALLEPPAFVVDDDAASPVSARTSELIHPLRGHSFPTLVDVEGLAVELEADRLDGASGPVETSARIELSGPASHPFDRPIRDLRIKVVLMSGDEAAFAWRRVTAPPLELSDADLKRRLPRPIASMGADAAVVEVLDPRASARVSALEDLGEVTLDPRALPHYLLAVESYALDGPTADDLVRIVEEGGTPDVVALGTWAANPERLTDAGLDDAARARLMDVIEGRLKRLRAPPGLGDLQRIHAMLALLRLVATSADIERVLGLSRPMRILLTSALLNYDEALLVEGYLELDIHGMQHVPSRSEYFRAYEHATQELRSGALHELLRLSYDPIDFRSAPAEEGLVRAAVQPQARALLEPLEPTNATAMLEAASDTPEIQREMLEFYVKVRHEPAVEPLVRWVIEHPEDAPSLGIAAAQRMGAAMVSPLLRHYVDPDQARDRDVARTMLLAVQDEHRPLIAQAIAALGVDLEGSDGSIAAILSALEAHESSRTEERAEALQTELLDGTDDPLLLPRRVRAADKLGRLSPERLREHATEIIAVHVRAALVLESDAPLETERALHQLTLLPFEDRQPEALDAVARTRAQLAARASRHDDAIALLLERFPTLDDEAARNQVLGSLTSKFASELEAGAWGEAERTIAAARTHIPELAPIAAMERELFVTRYFAALVLSGCFALSLVTTVLVLVVRAIARLLRRSSAEADQQARFDRHEAHVAQADAEVAELEDAAREGPVDTTIIVELAPEDPDDAEHDEPRGSPAAAAAAPAEERQFDELGPEDLDPGDAAEPSPPPDRQLDELGPEDLGPSSDEDGELANEPQLGGPSWARSATGDSEAPEATGDASEPQGNENPDARAPAAAASEGDAPAPAKAASDAA